MSEIIFDVLLTVGVSWAVVAAFTGFICGMESYEYPALALIWPVWFFLSVKEQWREWRQEHSDVLENGQFTEHTANIVYRYPARTWLSFLALWTWRIGITAAVAWKVWRQR